MSRVRSVLLITSISALSTGCASIVNGSNQVLSVETRHDGKSAPGAACELVNPKGKFFVTTPGTVTVHRAYDDLQISCTKEGLPAGMATAKSSTKPMAFGNIIFGGVIGAAVDIGTGAAYDYPSLLTVILGQTTAIDSPAGAAAKE
jgi:hypothetical protein